MKNIEGTKDNLITFDNDEEVLLYNEDKKYLFRATYCSGSSDVVNLGKFMIKQCFEELEKWKDYDPHFHFVDGYV